MNPAESDRESNGRFKQKLSDEQITKIRNCRVAGWSCGELAKLFHVDRSLISRVCKGERRKGARPPTN